MKINKEDAAFPVHEDSTEDGLTKLEYFAGIALLGLLANPTTSNMPLELKVSSAFMHAREMIRELNSRAENKEW